MNVKAMAAKYY